MAQNKADTEMTKEEINIRDLLKSIIAFIPTDTIRFDIDHELPPHLTEMDSFTQISRWECRKLDMDYTNYTLKFGVLGKKPRAEMNKLLGELVEILRQIKKEL